MHALFLITHPGTPILLLPSLQYAPPTSSARPPASPSNFAGVLTMDHAIDDATKLTVTAPPGLFTSPNLSVPGLPPEMVAHVQDLAGIWCVAVDPNGVTLAEWPAVRHGFTAESVIALFPDSHPFPVPPPQAGRAAGASPPTPYQTAIHDGIYTAALSHTWPIGHVEPPYQPSLSLAASITAHLLRRVSPLPLPPAGGIFGAVADPHLPSGPDEAAQLAARMDAAVAALRRVVVNGSQVGAGLLQALDKGVVLGWASPRRAAAKVGALDINPDNYPAPFPCGWDLDTRTAYLSPAFPPELDVAYLGAALYSAYVSLTGQSVVTKLLVPATVQSSPPMVTESDVLVAASNEAARAWILLAEISRAVSGATVTALEAFPWGPPALAVLPAPSVKGNAYDAAIEAAAAQAAQTLSRTLAPACSVLRSEALAVREQWFSPATRARLPRVTSVQPSVAPPPNASSSIPPMDGRGYISPDPIIATPPNRPPLLIYGAESPSPVRGALTVHAPGGGGRYASATLFFDRIDGVRVYIPNVPADDVENLLAAGRAEIICRLPDEATFPPDAVDVCRLAAA